MADNTYNGWKNYATWRVNLELVDDITSSLIGDQTFDSVSDLADYLKDETEEWAESLIGDQSTGAATLLGWVGAFLEDVDWHEIAETCADDLVREMGE